jgi:hypothetical protein
MEGTWELQAKCGEIGERMGFAPVGRWRVALRRGRVSLVVCGASLASSSLSSLRLVCAGSRGTPWIGLCGYDPGRPRVQSVVNPPVSENQRRWSTTLLTSVARAPVQQHSGAVWCTRVWMKMRGRWSAPFQRYGPKVAHRGLRMWGAAAPSLAALESAFAKHSRSITLHCRSHIVHSHPNHRTVPQTPRKGAC